MELFREQALLLGTLFNSEGPVSGQSLSKMTDFGIKTLKKEIDNLNILCEEKGFEIVSKSGSGYEIIVTDENLFIPFKEEVIHNYHRNLISALLSRKDSLCHKINII